MLMAAEHAGKGNIKVKGTLVQALRGSRGIAVLYRY
jgi:hypothetical protein